MSEASGILHTEVLELDATPEQVREFIVTPERILDYYPMGVEGGVITPGRAIWCRGEAGVSLLERLEEQCDDRMVVLLVTTAIGLEPPYTRERIEANVTFTMVEDWALAPSGSGTTLTKSWRDIVAHGEAPFPVEEAVREGAVQESSALVAGWNQAAQAATR